MANDDEKKLPSVRSARDLGVSFPDIPKTLTKKEGERIQKAVEDTEIQIICLLQNYKKR